MFGSKYFVKIEWIIMVRLKECGLGRIMRVLNRRWEKGCILDMEIALIKVFFYDLGF